MARPNGAFTNHLLLVGQKSFVAGCLGCLGVGAATFGVFFLVFVVFQAQFAALVRTVPLPALPFVIQIQSAPAVGQPCVTPASVAIEVIVSTEDRPDAPSIKQLKLPVQTPLFVCVRVPKGTNVRFTVRVTLPDGQVMPFGSEFTSDPSGKLVCLGSLRQVPNVEGVIRVDILTGTTVVGSSVVTLVP